MPITFGELERAALRIIQMLKSMPELENMKIAVIGDLALWYHLPDHRRTKIIDFAINKSSSPSSVKKRLLKVPNTPFVQKAEVLYYMDKESAREIQVNITPEWLSPYLPGSAQLLADIPAGAIPYISIEDLIVFKIDSCGHQTTQPKKERDALDAIALLELASTRGPVFLQDHQERLVEEGMTDVISHTARDKSWWEGRLGLPESESKTVMGSAPKSPPITVVVKSRKPSVSRLHTA